MSLALPTSQNRATDCYRGIVEEPPKVTILSVDLIDPIRSEFVVTVK